MFSFISQILETKCAISVDESVSSNVISEGSEHVLILD